MDAYVFAVEATQEAVDRLAAGIDDCGGGDGPARVVLPLFGTHALYVAVAADAAGELKARVDEVTGTPGLTQPRVYLASAPAPAEPDSDPELRVRHHDVSAYPTYATVQGVVGFALLTTQPGLATSVYLAARAVPGVVGVAVVAGPVGNVLVEATGATVDEVAATLDVVAGLPGVDAVATSIGSTELGAGLTSQ